MSKQLDDMWSSKWVQPEPREALIKDNRSLKTQLRSVIDIQEGILINQTIFASLNQNRAASFTVLDKWKHETIIGTVINVDMGINQAKVVLWDPYSKKDECVWLFMEKIKKAELVEIEDWVEEEVSF